jgi:hypothetical protein
MPLTGRTLPASIDLSRRGMPAIDSVHSASRVITSGRRRFRILRTVEVDEYEKNAAAVSLRRAVSGRKKPLLAAVTRAMKAKPKGDNFGGTARKAAKISISSGPLRTYKDLKNLMKFALKADDAMVARTPKIKTTATQGRVTEEEKNVKVTAYLYAASREDDNDFHLIIGRAPTKTPELYMTMEVSGLPPANSAALATLTQARNDYKDFFGTDLPGFTYDFYDPPIPVTIAGSLFFDVGHATGTRPGPQSLKSRMPTVWEVHPVTSIKLG